MGHSLRGILRIAAQRYLAHSYKCAYYVHVLRHVQPERDALCCCQYVHAGDVVLDLGANIGCYTKMFSDCVGPAGQVHALEPTPETFSYLLYVVQKLRLTNVFLYNVAVSCDTGTGHIELPFYAEGGKNAYRAHLADSGATVRVYRLDDLFPDLCPSLIKCDVEGRELDVIRGARNMIGRCHPAWLMEVSKPTCNETLKLMVEHGYMSTRLEANWLFTAPPQ